MEEIVIIVANKSEKIILESLIKHGTLNYEELQDLSQLPESTVFRSIKSLINRGHVTILNYERLSQKGGPNTRRYSISLG